MSKKTIYTLLCVFVLLLIAAIPLHLQKGFSWNNDFWRQTADHAYQKNKNNFFAFSPTDDGAVFDVTIFGKPYSLTMQKTGDDIYRFDSTDGWAMEVDKGLFFSYEVNGVVFSAGTDTLIVTDASHPVYQFAPCHTEVSFFYDEKGGVLGEHVDVITNTGYYIASYETWYDRPEMSTTLPEPIPFETGLRIFADSIRQTLYVNEQGEYLINGENLLMFEVDDYTRQSKSNYLRMLLHATENKAARRGHAFCFLLAVPCYLWGLAMLIWPEKLAFLGSRWQYRNEPELSDAGYFSMQLSAGILMLLSIVLLYLPYFRRL